MGPETVSTLRIWQDGMAVVRECYALTASWPKGELFGLTSQVRRAAVWIPANLAEGKGRGTAAEVARFSQIALGSVYELDTLLQIAAEQHLSTPDQIRPVRERLSNLAPQISAYVRMKRR